MKEHISALVLTPTMTNNFLTSQTLATSAHELMVQEKTSKLLFQLGAPPPSVYLTSFT